MSERKERLTRNHPVVIDFRHSPIGLDLKVARLEAEMLRYQLTEAV